MRRAPHVYSWEDEPAEEGSSEFVPSTGHSPLSGHYVPLELSERAARRRSGSRFGFKTLVVAFVLIVAVCGIVLNEVAKLLRT